LDDQVGGEVLGPDLASLFLPEANQGRLARAVSSTRYVIFGACLVEHVACRPGPAAGNVLKSLLDALGRTGLGRQIEQTLVGLGVLQHGGGFSVHGQNQRPLGLSQMAQKLCRALRKVVMAWSLVMSIATVSPSAVDAESC
jgi:hypothetical protein